MMMEHAGYHTCSNIKHHFKLIFYINFFLDIVYMHDSIRQNVLCFLADLFVGLEVKPVVKSVQLPGVKKDRIIDIPDPGK